MKSVLVLDGRVGKPQKSQPDPAKEATQPLKPEGNILLQGGQKDSHKHQVAGDPDGSRQGIDRGCSSGHKAGCRRGQMRTGEKGSQLLMLWGALGQAQALFKNTSSFKRTKSQDIYEGTQSSELVFLTTILCEIQKINK